ncbi:hypothetical protein BHE74_00007548 [Ensete ventricosum]|nr:hypothetical protein GW17_00003492 [Ensete ventricosum]RWW83919.1 hypothetical protein BHE74_00007548 [Ensete ventricosum]
MLHSGVTQECVGEGELPKKRTQSKVAEALPCSDRGHIWEIVVRSSIPCSHGGRALIVKGAEEVENTKANSKYQDKVEGQRL